jgi:putative restriction endonuclease
MAKGKRWNYKELLLACDLYFKTSFSKVDNSNPEIVELANLLGRTSASVALKLSNFASLDPELQKRGVRGAYNASKQDRAVLDEFYENIDDLAYQSEQIRAEFKGLSLDEHLGLDPDELNKIGTDKTKIIKTRINQSSFRKIVLANFNDRCCITGIDQPELLIAGHIKEWNEDQKNRINPRNGIAINALHDKAFEEGALTITPDHYIKISSILKEKKDQDWVGQYFLKYEGRRIHLPARFLPTTEFLLYHNQVKFKG